MNVSNDTINSVNNSIYEIREFYKNENCSNIMDWAYKMFENAVPTTFEKLLSLAEIIIHPEEIS